MLLVSRPYILSYSLKCRYVNDDYLLSVRQRVCSLSHFDLPHRLMLDNHSSTCNLFLCSSCVVSPLSIFRLRATGTLPVTLRSFIFDGIILTCSEIRSSFRIVFYFRFVIVFVSTAYISLTLNFSKGGHMSRL